MKIRLDKEEFLRIERAILYLQENPQSEDAINEIQDALNKCFGISTNITVVEPKPGTPWFIMSVYPDISTIDKVVDALMQNKDQRIIQSLWEETKNWYIEIDQRIFGINPKFTERELTAILLHEIGHIVCSNSITSRISNILRYKIAMCQMEHKALLFHKVFKGVLSLPILNACITNNKSSLREEIKADSFVKRAGYQTYLVSALKKLTTKVDFKDADEEMSKVADFSTNAVDQFRKRYDHIVRESVDTMLESLDNSPYLKNAVKEAFHFVYEINTYTESVRNISHIEWAHEMAEKAIAEPTHLITEAYDLFKKSLKRLNPTDLDYVDIKTVQCQNTDDKMMLVSYCRSKIDVIDYYISVVENPSLAKKYKCPHSYNELKSMKERYLKSIEDIKNFKLPVYTPGMMIKWPSGYSG